MCVRHVFKPLVNT